MAADEHRRSFLQGAGLGLALPALESLAGPLSAHDPRLRPQRLVCIGTYLGFHQASFFPTDTGTNYELSPVLRPLSEFRSAMTIFSGLDHRGRNGHEGWKAWMTGSSTGSISLDELVAAKVGAHTRFSSLQITCGRPPAGARLSFTKEGVALPMIGRPRVFYETLFRSDSNKQRIRQLLETNRSILDDVLDETRSLQRRVTPQDRSKLNEYLASVRDVERRLQKQQTWLNKSTPKIAYPLPEFDPIAPDLALECESIMYDLMCLALQTDSTRVLTFLVPGWSQVFTIDGNRLSAGYHGLSHHGNDPQKIAEYNLVGIEHVKRLAKFLGQLRRIRDAADQPLLDSTLVIFGSGMGDANTHDNSNLPTLIIGGHLRHGQHFRIERLSQGKRLGDLYLTVLHQFGVKRDGFAGASHNLNEYLL